MIGLWIEAMTDTRAYLAAEYDYHMIWDDEDRIIYIASLYKRLEKLGEMDYNTYPKELFDEGDTDTTDDNAEQKENTA